MTLLAATVVAAILSTSVALRQWAHHVDSVWLGERAMDTLARLRTSEDWSIAEPLRPEQDYAWLHSGSAPLRIAHALGESGTPTANTLAAMRRGFAAGFRVFEVDLVSERGELRCQHDPGSTAALVQDGCTFETLIAALPSNAWLVLDIKTDFPVVGQQIVDRVRGTADARRIVFQLYQPGDFALFNRWQRLAALPGPILTTYLTHRRIGHVAAQVARIGVRAFTLPLDRLRALGVLPAGVAVLVHPVHSCESWADALKRADGIYTLSLLRCAPPLSAESS